jgi:Fe-S oxidoreductase
MGLVEIFKKYKWVIPLITKADRETKRIILKNFRLKKKNFYPEGEYKADIKKIHKCMLCFNMCRFDCGTLQAAQKESMAPAYKSRIAYYLSIGKIDPADPANKDFVDVMYKCSNEENCKIFCPYDLSVVSLLEGVREDLNAKGLMPDYVKPILENLKNTNTVEDHDIFKTYKEKGIENVETKGEDDVFYHIGCLMMRYPSVVQSYIEILKKAGIKYSTNLDSKACCGAPAFTIRDLEIAKNFAEKNKESFDKSSAGTVLVDCPGCGSTINEKYNEVGVKIKPKIVHLVQYINQLLEEGKIKVEQPIPAEYKKVTIHDPCHLARHFNDVTSIRAILSKIEGLEIVESMFNKENTHCCGWSGALHWADHETAKKEASNRVQELKDTGAHVIISACPLCEIGLGHGLSDTDKDKIEIIDIAELLLKVL